MRRFELPELSQPVSPEALILATLCFADMVWTITAVKMGIARESNPILAPIIARSSLAFAAAKMFSFLMPLTILELIRHRRPELITKSLRIALAAYVMLYLIGTLHVHGVL